MEMIMFFKKLQIRDKLEIMQPLHPEKYLIFRNSLYALS